MKLSSAWKEYIVFYSMWKGSKIFFEITEIDYGKNR